MSHHARLMLATITLLVVSSGFPQLAASPQNPAKQAKAAAKQAKQQQKAIEKANDTQIRLTEAERLKAAYIFLAMANHDYNGFRAKAMKQLEHAAGILDASIMKNGTNGQKALARNEDIIAARAKFLAKHSGAIHESQALSDLQMREGLALVASVQPVLVERKQPKVLAHVNAAIADIEIALKIR